MVVCAIPVHVPPCHVLADRGRKRSSPPSHPDLSAMGRPALGLLTTRGPCGIFVTSPVEYDAIPGLRLPSRTLIGHGAGRRTLQPLAWSRSWLIAQFQAVSRRPSGCSCLSLAAHDLSLSLCLSVSPWPLLWRLPDRSAQSESPTMRISSQGRARAMICCRRHMIG